MINLRDQIQKRNEWIWENRGRSRQSIADECGLSESRVKQILVAIRKEKNAQRKNRKI